jgi:hypothetical protein
MIFTDFISASCIIIEGCNKKQSYPAIPDYKTAAVFHAKKETLDSPCLDNKDNYRGF